MLGPSDEEEDDAMRTHPTAPAIRTSAARPARKRAPAIIGDFERPITVRRGRTNASPGAMAAAEAAKKVAGHAFLSAPLHRSSEHGPKPIMPYTASPQPNVNAGGMVAAAATPATATAAGIAAMGIAGHCTPGRVTVAPATAQGCLPIALLTPSRPATPRHPHPLTSPNPTSLCTPKTDKGLRHFSAKVSSKVEQKGSTTYNEVADELVEEIGRELGIVGKYDHKNIRRRVYDALNVLMAIDIIRKDKKEIRWLGLPSEASQDVKMLEAERAALEKRTSEKRRVLSELVQRHVALRALMARNLRIETGAGSGKARLILPESNISSSNDRLYLPFILVNAPKDCRVHCEMLEDRTQYFFEFDSPFFINEDIELLKLMGLDAVTVEEAMAWLPSELIPFAPHKNNGMDDRRPPPPPLQFGRSGGGAGARKTPAGAASRKSVISSPSGQRHFDGGRLPPHLMPGIGRRSGPFSDTYLASTSTASSSSGNLSRRFRETLSSMADTGSSPVI